MVIKKLDHKLTVCKVADVSDVDTDKDFYFIGKTDEEISLVCKIWRGFRIQGVLDFSLIGILSKLSAILAENGVGIFAISTFNTDYILVKAENFEKALKVLSDAGYDVV